MDTLKKDKKGKVVKNWWWVVTITFATGVMYLSLLYSEIWDKNGVLWICLQAQPKSHFVFHFTKTHHSWISAGWKAEQKGDQFTSLTIVTFAYIAILVLKSGEWRSKGSLCFILNLLFLFAGSLWCSQKWQKKCEKARK